MNPVLSFARLVVRSTRSYLMRRQEEQLVPDPFWRNFCLRNGIPLQDVSEAAESGLHLSVFPSLVFPKTETSAAILRGRGYELLRALHTKGGASFSWSPKHNGLSAKVGGCSFCVEYWEELFILEELYIGGDYDFLPRNPCVFIDIGANVGYTSIFFAASVPGSTVMSYEPVPRNFERARANIAENQNLSNRISITNQGVHSSQGKMTIRYNHEFPGRSSIEMDGRTGPNDDDSIQVEVVEASTVISMAREAHAGRDIVVKLDCEGSEYAILDQLESSGMLSMVHAFLLEWHILDGKESGAERLRELFHRNGFDFYIKGRSDRSCLANMAFAVKA